MKVRELIEALSECDADAEVLLMSQPQWPFEYSIKNIAIREYFQDVEIANEGLSAGEARATRDREGRAARDVFIVEGSQLRYGSREAWSR